MKTSNSIIQLHKHTSREDYMIQALDNLEAFNIPMVLFIGKLNGLKMSLNKTTELRIDNMILQFGGSKAWLKFLRDYGQLPDKNKAPIFGAHSDFI